jgi:hypothetical protein
VVVYPVSPLYPRQWDKPSNHLPRPQHPTPCMAKGDEGPSVRAPPISGPSFFPMHKHAVMRLFPTHRLLGPLAPHHHSRSPRPTSATCRTLEKPPILTCTRALRTRLPSSHPRSRGIPYARGSVARHVAVFGPRLAATCPLATSSSTFCAEAQSFPKIACMLPESEKSLLLPFRIFS